MSRTVGNKRPRDEYLTPRHTVEAAAKKLRKRYKDFEPLNCLEPGCSWASHLDYAVEHFPSIVHTIGVDIHDQPIRPDHEFVHGDFIMWETDERFDFIFTNPPFTLSEDFFLKSKSLLTMGGLALMFQRIGFFASLRRRVGYRDLFGDWIPGLWTQINLLEVWICPKRPAMIGQTTTDACEYAYFLFDSSSPQGEIRLDWLDW